MEIKSTPWKPCSAKAWQECIEKMNAVENIVRMERARLEEVMECHRHCGGRVSRDLVTTWGKRWIKVQRARLYELVQEHGPLCEETQKKEKINENGKGQAHRESR